MKERRLSRIFEAVRTEPPPDAPAEFEARVMSQIRSEAKPEQCSFSDQLSAFFPKMAFAAVTIIALSVAGDLLLTALDVPEVGDGTVRISEQWLILESGI